ncbi:MAG: hypothetical protein ACLFT4_02255, partial [Bacteroidales bacterium]
MTKSRDEISLQVAPNGAFKIVQTFFAIDISLLRSYAHSRQVLPLVIKHQTSNIYPQFNV